jgi:hypothetical protein
MRGFSSTRQTETPAFAKFKDAWSPAIPAPIISIDPLFAICLLNLLIMFNDDL